MKSRFYAGVGIALLCAPAILGWAPPPSADQDLRSGKPFSEVAAAPNGAVLIRAAIDIPAPAKVIWEVMNDCKYANRLVTTVTSCKVLQNDPTHQTDLRETVTRGNLVVPTLTNIVREQYDPYRVIRFEKAGGNLTEERGEWRLTPVGGGAVTLVTYENLVGADILAPAFVVRGVMREDTAKVMMNLRRESIAAQK
jgi:uncharacterized membrane protein